MSKEFKGDSVQVTVSQEPGCQVKFDIFVTPEGTEAAYTKALKSITKEVSFPGFRKGKAPRSIVLERYGKYVDQEWNELLLNTAFREAMALANIYPLSEESIKKPKMEKTSREEGTSFSITFESAPDTPLVKPEEIKLEGAEPKPVTDEHIEERIKEVRLYHATWEDVEGRPAQEGDFVTVDIEGIDPPKGMLAEDSQFEIQEGKMGEWMRKALIGANVDDVVEGTSEKHPESEVEDFQPTECKITVKKVQVPTLPELDDEFAKKVGLPAIAEFRGKVEEGLKHEANQALKEKLRVQLENFLLENYPFEVPASLVGAEKRHMEAGLLADLAESEESEEALAARKAEIQEEAEKKSKDSFRLFFLARKIADENSIQVSKDEVMQEVMRQVYAPGGHNLLSDSNDAGEVHSRVYASILSQKAKDYLVEQVMGAKESGSQE